MDNLGILVQAILSLKDTTSSKNQIAKELPKLESQLQSDKNTRVKIVAGLDIAKSKNLIQSQLNTLANQAKAPAIKVGIDITGANGKNGQPVIKPILDRSAYKDIDSYINAISAKLSQSKIGDISSITKGIKESLGANSPEVKSAVAELVNALKLTPNNQKAIADSYSNLIESIRGTISSSKIVGDVNFEKNLADEIYRISTSYANVQTQAQQTSNVVANANANIGNSARTISTQYRTEFGVVTDVVKQAEAEFARFGEVSAVSNKSVKALNGVPEHFKDFTIQVKSATGEVQKFFYTFENVGDNKNPVFKYMLQNINEADAGVKRLADDIEKAKAQYTSKLAGFESTNSQIKTGLSAEIAKVNEEINKLGTNNGSIQNLKVAFDNLTASANKIKENLKATGASLNPIDNAINKYKNMDNVLKEITTSFNNLSIKPTGLGDSLNSVKSQLIELQNLEKSEGGYTETWAKKYRDVSLAVAEVKTNIELALKAEKSDKDSSYQTQLKYLNKIKEETNTIISLKRKMVNAGDEEKALYQHEITNAQKRIQYDVQQLEKKKLLTNEAKYLVNTYKEEIALQDRINNAKLNDKASTQRITDIKSYNAEIDKAITKLNSLNNSSTFTKNASNPAVTQTKQEINSLITAYQNLATKLQGNITPAGLETVRTELTQLNARFNDATTTAKRFETELRSDNSAEQLAQKVALLTQRIKAYRQANSKSEKLFGGQYDSMLSQLANPNIDLNAYNAINKQFQTMRQEINAANVAGKNLWQTLKEKVAKFTGWMSMTYAVSMFTRSIRQALTELKEVDTVLTEISKANDKLTDSQLAQIGSNSFGIASKYGKTATDYLTGVQEMSRAGYANAEAMGELSTAAQGAGDMTADVANQFIIAADKAYKMNGSVEELTKTLDGINYITNNNAVNMSELSEGFSIVSSTAASFGVRADELAAALGTMAATTQQSGSEVARAFRAILLNIRQVSDEEENIDAEGLTKYEKACNALGVSLKEVKDGVLQLRDPMQVLKELSIEYNKLSETDLKRTNLLNSVGGKSLPRCIEICN